MVTVLEDDLLDRIRSRAGDLDRDNAFFHADLEKLRDIGYLRALVPSSFGGLGLSVAEVSREQRRLAAAAPATALGVNMHLIWTAVALTLHERGDDSFDVVLREAAEGHVFAFGISERGNDQMLFDSVTRARRDGDDYLLTGTKIFTTLSPVWTRLGVHGRDDDAEGGPQLVFGFLERGDGVSVADDWNALGMRATHSSSTRLQDARLRAERVMRRVAPGPSDDSLQWAIFVVFELLLASVYAGIGDGAVSAGVDWAWRRGRADDELVRARLADAALALDGVHVALEALTGDLGDGAPAGAHWFRQVSGLKVRAVDAARGAVDAAIEVAGGAAFDASGELARLYRDVLAGVFQPTSRDSTRSMIARDLLGPLEG